jgi:basic membrane protein A and related proteins
VPFFGGTGILMELWMKKRIFAFVVLLMVATSLFAASGVADLNDGVFRIAMLINGDLGDMSFWDSANEGMLRFAKDHPEVEVKIVEMGSSDSTIYESTLTKTANEAYDLIIVGTSDMREPLQRLVKKSKYKDRRFIIFDTEIKDGAASKYSTVHSIMFSQNEGGYLAGVLAALISIEQGYENTAFIGGASNDIINDFAVGFVQGVQAVNETKGTHIGVYNSFIGDFVDSPKGKSLALAYYNSNVGILFAAASQAGIGCIEAAKISGKTIIGVDSDQYSYYKDSDPSKANAIVTSIEKRVGDTLYEACEKFINGTLTYGDLEVLGVKEGKIGYSNNEHFTSVVSASIQDYLKQASSDIASGKIVVKSGLKRYMSATDRYALLDSLNPTK